MSESFEDVLMILRAYLMDHKWSSGMVNRLKTAHDHEIEHIGKAEYHRGYEDGRHSMDAEHYAVSLRLRALPLDGDTQENLTQIARAVWHSDFGWTQGACRALRDELVRLLGGVSERPYPTSTYDVLGNERHKAVCRLRHIRDCLKNDSTCNSLNIADAIGAKLDVGDHLHESICDRLIYLLGGDQPSGIDVLREMDADETSPSDVTTSSITNELRECVETASKSHDHCISEAELLEIADRIDEQEHRLRKQRDGFKRAMCAAQDLLEKRTTECDELREKLEEAEFAIADWREREKSFDTSERLRDELRERLEENEEALSRTAGKLAMAETRLRDARAKLDVLEENGLTLMHRTLKNMLGETKNTHDVLRAKVEAMPSFDRERRRLMMVADESERRCSELLDLLRDAAKDFKTLMEEKDTYANGRKA